MVLGILCLILFIIVKPGFPALSPLFVATPEISPKKEFGYLQTPILRFFTERLSSQGYNVYPAGERGASSGNLIKSRFIFDRLGKVQMELALVNIIEKREIFKVTESATFEDFWVKLEGLLNSFSNLPPKQVTPPQEVSTALSMKVQKSKEEKESILSKINPFRAISKLLPRKEEPLKIRIQVPPPPQPPFYATQVPNSQPLYLPPQPVQPQPLPSPPLSQPPTSGSSPWQWF